MEHILTVFKCGNAKSMSSSLFSNDETIYCLQLIRHLRNEYNDFEMSMKNEDSRLLFEEIMILNH